MEDALAKELESKINFNTKRELQEYRPELGFKAYTEVFTVLTPEFIFKVLCGACQTAVPGFTVSEDTYKVKNNSFENHTYNSRLKERLTLMTVAVV